MGEKNLAEIFERAVSALPYEAAFKGVEVVTFSSGRRTGSSSFTLMIDREGGVDMALCERISKHVRNLLDEADAAANYTLEVESAGLNRPLYTQADYARFVGREVKIVTSLTIAGAKTHRGKLGGARGDLVLLVTPTGELPIPQSTIKSANIEYDVRADLKRDKQERARTK